MWITPPHYKYANDSRQFAFFRDGALTAFSALFPASSRWLRTTPSHEVFFTPANQPRPSPGQEPTATEQSVSPGDFLAMGGKFLAGRDFSRWTRLGSAPVAIINQTLARRYWRGANPVGDHLVLLAKVYDKQDETPLQSLEVVGVVADIKTSEYVWQDHPEFSYIPHSQHPMSSMGIAIDTARSHEPGPAGAR